MIMQRTPSRLLVIPIANTMQMKAAKALQTAHILPNHILLKADAALCVLNEVFLRGFVREDRAAV
jgi:hypothetical protein